MNWAAVLVQVVAVASVLGLVGAAVLAAIGWLMSWRRRRRE